MNRPRSQTDSAPNRAPNFSQQDGILQHAEPLPPRGRDSGLGNRHQITDPDTLPKNGQNTGTIQRRLQDHPEWSAYVADRHILEEAIDAGAKIEYSDYYGRYCLAWHEKLRDGSRGRRDSGGDECRARGSSQLSRRKYSGKYRGRNRGRPRRFNQPLENTAPTVIGRCAGICDVSWHRHHPASTKQGVR